MSPTSSPTIYDSIWLYDYQKVVDLLEERHEQAEEAEDRDEEPTWRHLGELDTTIEFEGGTELDIYLWFGKHEDYAERPMYTFDDNEEPHLAPVRGLTKLSTTVDRSQDIELPIDGTMEVEITGADDYEYVAVTTRRTEIDEESVMTIPRDLDNGQATVALKEYDREENEIADDPYVFSPKLDPEQPWGLVQLPIVSFWEKDPGDIEPEDILEHEHLLALELPVIGDTVWHLEYDEEPEGWAEY